MAYDQAAADWQAEARELRNENEALRRRLEFIETLADGGELRVNGIPWREAFDRLNKLVSDPV